MALRELSPEEFAALSEPQPRELSAEEFSKLGGGAAPAVPELPTAELPEMPKNTLAEFEQRVPGYLAADEERALDDDRVSNLEKNIIAGGEPAKGSEKDPGDKGTPEQKAAHRKYALYKAAKERQAAREAKPMGRGEAAAWAAGGGASAGWLPKFAQMLGRPSMEEETVRLIPGMEKVTRAPEISDAERKAVEESMAGKIAEAHQTYPYQSAAVSGAAAIPTMALVGPAGYGFASGASQPADNLGELALNTAVGTGIGTLGRYFPKATAGTLGGAGLAATIDERASIPGFTDTQAGRNIAMGSAIPAVGGGIAGLISKSAGKRGAAQQSMLEEGIGKKAAPLEKKQVEDYRVSEESIRSKQAAAKDLYVEAEKKAKAAYKSKKAAEGGFTRKALDRYVSRIDEALSDTTLTPEERAFWETFRDEARADARNIAATKQSPQELAKSQASEKWDPIIEIREARKNKAAADAKAAQQSPETLIESLAPDERASLIKAAEEQRLSEDFKRSSSVLPVGEEPMPYAEVQKGGVRRKLESAVAKRAADLEATKDSMLEERLRQSEHGRVVAGPEAPQPLDTQLTQLAKLYAAAKASQSRAKSAGQIEVPTTAISRLIPGILQQSSGGQTNTADEDVKRKIFDLIAAQTGGK